MSAERIRGIATRAVHAGERREGVDVRPTSTPIYNASSFLAPSIADIDGISPAMFRDTSTREMAIRPSLPLSEPSQTWRALKAPWRLDPAWLPFMRHSSRPRVVPASRIVASQDVYGRTRALLSRFQADFGVTVELVDLNDDNAIDQALSKQLAVLLVETLSNPLVKVADIPGSGQACPRSRWVIGGRRHVYNAGSQPSTRVGR